MSVRGKAASWGSAHDLPARLNKRISIEQPNDVSDGAGGISKGWSHVASVWAEILPQRSGGERLFGGQLEARASHRITIRYRSGITADMRVVFGARIFNIRYIANPQEANAILVIDADEGVAV